MPSAIQVKNLSKVYPKGKQEAITAVNALTLDVQAGQVFGLLGANGAGKTTTIKMICGLITPTNGEVRLNGLQVRKDRSQAMRQIGAVLEGTRNIYWRLTAWENLMYFGRLKGVPARIRKRRAEVLLKELDLWDRRNDKIRTFSRGMQQKVAIACAVIADPPIVLLDEPTLGLDVSAARTVKEWVAHLARERQKTIVLTTHQLDIAQALCDRVAIINKGHLLTNQPTNELLSLFQEEYFEIRIKGHLNGHAKLLGDRLSMQQEDNEAILSGKLTNQADIVQLINQMHSLGLTIQSFNHVQPNLEDVFISYTEGGA